MSKLASRVLPDSQPDPDATREILAESEPHDAIVWHDVSGHRPANGSFSLTTEKMDQLAMREKESLRFAEDTYDLTWRKQRGKLPSM